MGQLHISVPGFMKPVAFKRTSGSSSQKGFKVQFPSKEVDESHTQGSAEQASEAQCKTIELRIIQDGKIYRSKAEEERLIALGQWHHRRQRRRERMRR